jgi:hypothetical protein
MSAPDRLPMRLAERLRCSICGMSEGKIYRYFDKWYCDAHKLSQYYADECRSGDLHPPIPQGPLDAGPPDLQELVARFGGYDLIPDDAWRDYDAAVARWRIDRLVAMGLKPISPEEMKRRKRP